MSTFVVFVRIEVSTKQKFNLKIVKWIHINGIFYIYNVCIDYGEWCFILNVHCFVVIFDCISHRLIYDRSNLYNKKIKDYNEIMNIQDEMKFPAVNTNIVEVKNSSYVNSFHNFYIKFWLFLNPNSYEHKQNYS